MESNLVNVASKSKETSVSEEFAGRAEATTKRIIEINNDVARLMEKYVGGDITSINTIEANNVCDHIIKHDNLINEFINHVALFITYL
jgi:hypothetical protein